MLDFLITQHFAVAMVGEKLVKLVFSELESGRNMMLLESLKNAFIRRDSLTSSNSDKSVKTLLFNRKRKLLKTNTYTC